MEPRALQHSAALVLVTRRPNDHIGNASEVGEVKGTVMGGAVLTHQPRAIDRQGHIEVLQCDIVNQLIVPALQESGVDREHGLEPVAGHARGQCHGVLLGDGHVVEALGELGRILDHARSLAHGWRNAHYPIILRGQITQPLSEDVLIFRCLGFGWNGCLGRLSGLQLVYGVVADRVALGRREPLALHCANMQKLRPF